MTLNVQGLLALILTGSLLCAAGPAPAIGVAKANGSFRLDNALIRGNSSLFEGSVLETSQIRSELVLERGARLVMMPDSRTRVYSSRAVLERGASQVRGSSGFALEAQSLRVIPSTGTSVAWVSLNPSRKVVVEAAGGPVEVKNAQDVLVARVLPGSAIEFSPQARASTATKMSGCLVKKGGRYFLTDSTTNVTAEIQGKDLDQQAGNRVEVTGSQVPGAVPAGGASQLVQALEVRQLGRGCTSPAGAAAAGAAGAAGAAAGGAAAAAGVSAGLSTAAVVAIVGGVAAAGTIGGMYAAGVFEDERPVSVR